MEETILYEIKDKVAIITLNRPAVFNSFNREMALSLQEKLKAAQENDKIRAVMITGNGKAFSAGQDLGEVTGPDAPGFKVILGEHFNPIIRLIRAIGKPIVAAVNGVAAGAGANMALCCDVVLASSAASFIQAFSKLGLIPDSGGTFFVPRMIGFQKASAIMMLGEKINAADAERMGMVYKIFPEESFHEEVMKISVQLAEMPTRGLALTKLALNQSMISTLEEQLQIEEQFQIAAGHTADYKEGVTAFIEKRKAHFAGK